MDKLVNLALIEPPHCRANTTQNDGGKSFHKQFSGVPEVLCKQQTTNMYLFVRQLQAKTCCVVHPTS